jgi:hypothetical protein
MNIKTPYIASVKLHTDEKWQWHFRNGFCHREVISYLDLQAGRHYARFVYSSPGDIAAHTQDYRKPKDWCRKCEATVPGAMNVDSSGHCAECGMPIYHRPYALRTVKDALANLIDYGIVIPGQGVTQKGVPKEGYYVVDHHSATMPVENPDTGNRCVWWSDLLEGDVPVPFNGLPPMEQPPRIHTLTLPGGGQLTLKAEAVDSGVIAPPDTFKWKASRKGGRAGKRKPKKSAD